MRHVLLLLSMLLAALSPLANGGTELQFSKEHLQVLQRELGTAQENLARAIQKAKSDKEREAAVDHYRQQVHALAARTLESARKGSNGGSAAIDALVWVVRLRLNPESGEALELLTHDYAQSKLFIQACRSTIMAADRDFDAAETLLRTAMAKSPHREVKGFACFYLAELLKHRAEEVRHLDQNPMKIGQYGIRRGFGAKDLKQFIKRGPNDLCDEAEQLYEQTIAHYGDVRTHRKVSLGEVAKGELFDMLHLSIGQQVPDIVGQDSEGKSFKLSDYHGKVIVLTFSGNWCGPCRRMYPQDRRLVERLKNRPFTLLSVTNDNDKGTLRKAIKDGEITWRCWWDEGMNGPICLKWGINKFPSIFVIDHKGAIRYRDVCGDKLDEAVDMLLKEYK